MIIDIQEINPIQVMSSNMWKFVDHFRMDEGGRNAFGDPLKMNVHLIYWLDVLRKNIDTPIYVNCGYEESGHKDGSQHGLGTAVDIHAKQMSAVSLIWEAMKLPFTGLGLYKYWNSPGVHIDMRILKPGEARKQWMRTKTFKDKNGKIKGGTYRNLKRMDLVFDIE